MCVTAEPRYPLLLRPKYAPFLSLTAAEMSVVHQSINPRMLLKSMQASCRVLALGEFAPENSLPPNPELCARILQNCLLVKHGSYFTTSYQLNTFASFCAKRYFNCLPTMERQHAWLSCYPDSNCRRCHSTTETATHLTTCPESVRALNEIRQELRLLLPSSPDFDNILHDVLFTHGIPPLPLLSALAAALPPAKAMRKLSTRAASLSYERIWKPRCRSTVEWELARGIRQQHKLRRVSTLQAGLSVVVPRPVSNRPHYKDLLKGDYTDDSGYLIRAAMARCGIRLPS
jgi:hypothetical protein